MPDEMTAPGPYDDELVYESGGLPKTTNWWGAFVIGLAGTILVTGIAPVMVTELGAASVPVIVFITITGYLVCLLLAELSAMMPDRSGGLPSYAYPAFKDRWPRFAEHINGFTAWAYWLGWFPVAPLNMILASFYITDRFNLTSGTFAPLGTKISWWTLGISVVGLIVLAIPAVRGLRFGTFFATALAILSMIPLTFLAIAWIFHPSVVHFGQLFHFHHTNGTGFFSPLFGHGWLTLYIAFSFLLTWNVIAMEAAACYIGETRNPDRDAKIAMNLEGLYGLFIYTMIPVAFIIVLGVGALGDSALVDPKTIFVHFASRVFGAGTGSSILNWLVAIMLILALILSALNAITGTARSLHQMSTDGQFPKFFQRVNHHGVPHRAMIFNVGWSILVVFAGGAVQIYTLSNVGYLASFLPVLVGYFLLRKHRPNVRRPFRLPEWMKYVALAIALLYAVIYFYGGPVYASCACNAAGTKTLPYYFIGWGVLLLYLPLYYFRKRVEDRREKAAEPVAPTTGIASGGAGP
ncbi:MAG TPA: APC family permease [Solirubrobacteraceae bacterium]|jgi:amino acid transporter|nr:APC family permease [Solirubrobacteraceae bacterium]